MKESYKRKLIIEYKRKKKRKLTEIMKKYQIHISYKNIYKYKLCNHKQIHQILEKIT